MKNSKRKKSYLFIFNDSEIRKLLLILIIVSIIFIIVISLFVFSSHINGKKSLFFLDVKNFFFKHFWIPILLSISWGFIVIRLAYVIAVKRISAPFQRFQNHMNEISGSRVKKNFIHRNYDDHMKDISGAFNEMIDTLFEELEKRDKKIELLQKQLLTDFDHENSR